MAELTDSLNQLLEGHADQISQRIDADEGQTRQAIQSAVPALLAALSADAERGDGLKQAIAQDHDGSIIDQLAEYLDGSAQLNPRTTNGSGILDHALGDRQEPMARVLQLRFGLEDGRSRTLEEVGRDFNVTRERIRQIEAKALRKLRHPSRSRKLKDYLE